jgi:hypothetical protein
MRHFEAFPVLLAALALASAGCLPPEDEMAEAMYQVEVYAAAAREYQARHDAWPADAGGLLTVLASPPSFQDHRVTIEEIEAGPGTAATLYFATGSEKRNDDSAWNLRGRVTVQPKELEDLPAAIIEWDRGIRLLHSRGTITMGECYMGRYEQTVESDAG